MATSKRRRDEEDSGDEAAPKKKGGAGLWIGLGVGCGGLVLLLVCGGAGVGIYLWQKPAVDKPIENVIQDVKAKNPIKGTAPLGKTPLTELDPPVAMWDFTIRVPKGMSLMAENQKNGDMFFYQWMNPKAPILAQLNINKWATNETNALPRVIGDKLKSGPGDPFEFDTPELPQPVEINGLIGARKWQRFPKNMPDGPMKFKFHVIYYYLVDGWGYHFNCHAFGATEAEARQKAELLDVSICTLRKR
jgi:hypothetical protein